MSTATTTSSDPEESSTTGRSSWRLWAIGLLGGVLLSAVRAPLGLDLLRLQAVDGPTAASFRAAALLALAVACSTSRFLSAGFAPARFLAAATVGFLVHGMVLDVLLPLGGRMGCALALIGLAAAIHVLGRAEPVSTTTDEDPALLERFGLLLAGAGSSFALESVARVQRNLSLGLERDEVILGAVLLVLAVLGAAAFGRFIPPERRRIGLACGLALAALAGVLGNLRLEGYEHFKLFNAAVSSLGSLFTTLSATEVNVSHIGTWQITAALATATFVIPGLVLGTALSGVRSGRELGWCLAGASIGVLAIPFVLRSMAAPQDPDTMVATAHQSILIGGGAFVAAVGAALVVARGARGTGRALGFVCAGAAGFGPFLFQIPDPWLFSPWDQTPVVTPRTVQDGANGLLTIEPAQGYSVATLDRIRLTPTRGEERGDEIRIRKSIELFGDAAVGGGIRVLLVGQLTPLRAEVFGSYEGLVLEHTSPWWRDAELLWTGLQGEGARPPLPMSEAKRRLDAGEYDLVVVPPIFGPRLHTLAAQFVPAPARAPRRGDWDLPRETLAVIWIDTAAELSSLDLGAHVLLSLAPIEEPCVGLVVGEPVERGELVSGAGPRLELATLAIPSERGYERRHLSRSRLFRRLSENSPEDSALRFLAAHYEVQVESTPFTARDDRIELAQDALADLRSAALADTLPEWLRSLILDVVRILKTKRRPDLILQVALPVVETHGPWFDLEVLVLSAHMEFDQMEEVGLQLADLLERAPYDINMRFMAADWEEHRGRPEVALGHLASILDIQPARADVLRRLAYLAHELGHPQAPRWAEQALEASPEDVELKSLLGEEPVHEDG